MTFQLTLSLLLVAAAVVYLAWQVVVFMRRRETGCDGCGAGKSRRSAVRKLPRAPSRRPERDG